MTVSPGTSLTFDRLLLSYPEWNDYPNWPDDRPNPDGRPTLWELIGGDLQKIVATGQLRGAAKATNPCAIQMSFALNKCGIFVPEVWGKDSETGAKIRRTLPRRVMSDSTPSRWWFFLGVNDLKPFLDKHVVMPHEFTTDISGSAWKKFLGSPKMQGIIIFRMKAPSGNGSAHVTLWNGEHTVDDSEQYATDKNTCEIVYYKLNKQ